MSTVSLPIPVGNTPGTSVTVPNLDGPRTYFYAAGDSNDITDVEASDDGVNWVKIGSRQYGATWTMAATAKTQNTRLNRINVGPAGATAVGFVAANDVVTAAQIGPASNAAGFGNATVASNIATTNAVAQLVNLSPALNGTTLGIQVELNLAYRNTTTGVCGSRKVTGTARVIVGAVTIEAQTVTDQNDNAVFGANIATTLVGNAAALALSLTGIAATNIDWAWTGVLNVVV